MNEISELIKYEGYGVDREGNVYCRRTWKPVRDIKTGKIITQTIYLSNKWRKVKASKFKKKNNVFLYSRVSISIKNIVKTKRVHKLIAEAFIPNPNNYSFVCHKDGNPENNKAENLYWGTPKQNQQDRYKHGTMCFGSKNFNSKFSEESVYILRKIYQTGKFTKAELSKILDIENSTICRIISYDSYPHVA